VSQAYSYPHKHLLTLEGQHPIYLQQILNKALTLLDETALSTTETYEMVYYFGSTQQSLWSNILQNCINPSEVDDWDLSISGQQPPNTVLCQMLSNRPPGLLFWETEETGLAQQIADHQPHRVIVIKDGQYQAPVGSLGLVLQASSKLGSITGRSVLIGSDFLFTSLGKSCANLFHLLGATVYWPADLKFSPIGLDQMGYDGPCPSDRVPDVFIGKPPIIEGSHLSLKLQNTSESQRQRRAVVQALLMTFGPCK